MLLISMLLYLLSKNRSSYRTTMSRYYIALHQAKPLMFAT